MSQEELFSEKEIPALDLIYKRAIHSYDGMVDRINAQDQKIQSLFGLSSLITVSIPIIGSGTEKPLDLCWVIPMFLLFLASICIGLYAIFSERMTAIKVASDPKVLLGEDWRRLSLKGFQYYWTKDAGESFENNLKVIDKKWRAARLMSVLIGLEVAAILAWATFRAWS